MMKLLFYFGPGDIVTRLIRFLTHGPYSHVELQFSDGARLFASGHGIYTGGHMICDRKVYDEHWDVILLPATQEQENATERSVFRLIGFPFDWRGMVSFLFPFVDRRRKAKYCSSIILQVLQDSLHMFPGVNPKISPNGIYRLFLSAHSLMISAAAPDHVQTGTPAPAVSLSLNSPSAPGHILSADLGSMNIALRSHSPQPAKPARPSEHTPFRAGYSLGADQRLQELVDYPVEKPDSSGPWMADVHQKETSLEVVRVKQKSSARSLSQ